MGTHQKWLRQEMEGWLADGLLDTAQAQSILARYAHPGQGLGRIIFTVIGAVLMGLGVILFFAYNWAELPKLAKLALVFGMLLAAHGAAIFLGRRNQVGAIPVEGLHALGTMFFGAGIWLVAQIYHIDEHYPNAFLYWSLGALTLAWAMPSLVQGMLAVFLIGMWSAFELFDFRIANHLATPLVLLGLLPLAWWRRSTLLLFWSLVLLMVVLAFANVAVNDDVVAPLLYTLGATCVIGAVAAGRSSFREAAAPLRGIGLVVCAGLGYLLTFRDLGELVGEFQTGELGVQAYVWSVVVGCLVGIALALRAGWAHLNRYERLELGLVTLGLLVVQVFAWNGQSGGWLVALVFNGVVLGIAVSFILQGSAELRPRLVTAGCLLFAAVALGRYADLFHSLLMRSAVFLLLGAGLFAVGSFYSRQRRGQEVAS